ncbi:hypothetical protein OH77DRAFT_667148 [Trametes cingulata]|nr:hypothetical protein OH77DRAFT_667148 [Trametes cingulata]
MVCDMRHGVRLEYVQQLPRRGLRVRAAIVDADSPFRLPLWGFPCQSTAPRVRTRSGMLIILVHPRAHDGGGLRSNARGGLLAHRPPPCERHALRGSRERDIRTRMPLQRGDGGPSRPYASDTAQRREAYVCAPGSTAQPRTRPAAPQSPRRRLATDF